MIITLASSAYTSIDDFYRDISVQMHFPDHFMHNLISLRECLIEVVKEPVTVIWPDHARARMSFGVSALGVTYFPEILKILDAVPNLTLELS
jgi:RNAse (barnase) inhibitor barstar